MTYFTSSKLIADVKRRALIPDSQKTFSDIDFLEFANSELKIGLLPSIISVNEEYYVYPQEVAIEQNKSNYSIPYRAVGGKLRDLFYKDGSGNLCPMTRISPEDKNLYQQTNLIGTKYYFYYIQGNDVILTPGVDTNVSGSLVFTFFMRPSDLVEESRVAIITGISTDTNTGTTIYNVNAVPSGMTVAQKLDLLQAKPGNKIRDWDINATAVNVLNKTITFNTSNVDPETEIGDHIAFAGECIIPQCPLDLQSVLSQRTAARCLEALGDTQGLTNANTKLQEMEVKTLPLIDQRVEGSVKKVVNKRGLLNSSRIRRGRGWY